MAIGANRRTVFELYKITPEEVRKSQTWFNDQVTRLSTKKITPNRIMNEEGWHLTSKLTPGKMYFFYYDPKFKETLPYYDQFPLVLPYDRTKEGFIGLNLHYLDYKMRMGLFQTLLETAGAKHLTETSKIKYSWATVSSVAKLAPAKACVKQYLISHVKSPYCEVPPEFWHTALMLPVQRFVGANKESVWKESRKYR